MRGKQRTPTEICGDCGAAEPGWASLNRGVLLCNECCSVHRSLGRHVSYIRSLQHGFIWPQSLFEMVHALVSNGSNSIWEHSLLDPSNVRSGKRKPNSKEPLHPGKSEFIRAKYQRLDFVHRLKDEDEAVIKDLSKQLHSSVRTGNLETCLRLLSLGAQANFYNEEKGNTPLHIASKEGQTLQCELLMVYGGSPGAVDKNGKTPADLAREEGLYELAERLVQGQYELTDRLTNFVCGKKPDHSNLMHFLIPEMADNSLERSDAAEKARKKLQALSNRLFEELAMDVYDEVDRRELDTIWSSLHMSSLIPGDRMVPFLPLNPELSSTRNQGRQKLARFSARDFATLIIDILKEAKRRQLGILAKHDVFDSHSKPPPLPPSTHERNLSPGPMSSHIDDEPLYDRVPSDDDYKEIDDVDVGTGESKVPCEKRTESGTSSEFSDGPDGYGYANLKDALAAAEAKIQQLLLLNKEHNQEIHMLQSMVHKLQQENTQLRAAQRGMETPTSPKTDQLNENEDSKQQDVRGSRPYSMFEIGSSEKPSQTWQPGTKETDSEHSSSESSLTPSKKIKPKLKPKISEKKPRLPSVKSEDGDRPISAAGSDYDNTSVQKEETTTSDPKSPPATDVKSGTESSSPRLSSTSSKGDTSPRSQSSADASSDEKVPTAQQVISATEQITRNIQKLLAITQEGDVNQFSVVSEEIVESVKDMGNLFPEKRRLPKVVNSLKALNAGAASLHEECVQAAKLKPEVVPVNSQKIIAFAYDTAKAAKQLVSIFQ